MKRVLCIVGAMNAGGAETLLMKIYRALDKEIYQMDFCVASSGIYDDEIKKLGGKLYFTIPKSNNLLKSFKSIKSIVQENEYEYVLRVSQNSMSVLELIAAKKGGAKRTAFRSSNSKTCGGIFDNIVHNIFMPLARMVPEICIAPSTEAADFMFGKNSVKNHRSVILHNGIDMNVFSYSDIERKKIRTEFGISETSIVIGNIGRFNYQKNHDFLIDIFYNIKKSNDSSMLMLVGTGERQNEIMKKIESKNLSDSVIFTGVRKDIPSILSAFDIMIMPSLFEGMPNTVIEAQATGLPCLISDTITEEADITGLVKYKSLSDSTESWAEEAKKLIIEKRISQTDAFIKEKYDINSVVEQFVQYIFGE